MKSSWIVLAAGLLAFAAGAAGAAEPKAGASKTGASKADATNAEARQDDACPDLSGKFECPAVARFKQKAMTITVKDDPGAKTFEFAYDDGSPAVKVAANGKRKGSGKIWSSYVCRDRSLIQIVFKNAKTMKASGGSRQRLDKNGDYEVSGPDGKVSLLCRRAKAP